MQDIDEDNDRKYERKIRSKIGCLEDLLSIEKDLDKRLEYLREILELYDDLRMNVLNYTREDERKKRKCLKSINDIVTYKYNKIRAEIKYKKLRDRSMNDHDFSWDEYENEEKYLDERDEGEDR